MLRVMVESPYRAQDLETLIRNLTYGNAAVRDSLLRGEAPFAMHLFYPNWLCDDIETERAKGIACGLAWLERADLVAVYQDHGVTTGMAAAIAWAKSAGVRVEYRSILQSHT